MGPPNTSGERFANKYTKELKNDETKNLWKSVFALKVVNPFTHALGPPFIERRSDFYIPRLPSDLNKYSKCEHVHECLLHPVIRGANFIHLQAGHLFTPWTRNFDASSLTWFFHGFRLFTHEDYQVYRFPLRITEMEFPEPFRSPSFHSSKSSPK
jgi:hypothetical protein